MGTVRKIGNEYYIEFYARGLLYQQKAGQQKEVAEQMLKEVEEKMNFNWQEVFEIFKRPNVSGNKVKFPNIDEDAIRELLVEKHEFSADRVEKQLGKLRDAKGKQSQKTLF